jgi:hypothetical protein
MSQLSLTDVEIDALSVQIDQQINALGRAPADAVSRGEGGHTPQTLPDLQRRAIEIATGEPAERFWTRFKHAAHKDLCHPDGLLYQQWHKWGDLQNKDVIRSFTSLLAGMGLSGQVLPVVIVATAVIVLHLGVNAICDEGDAP